MQKMLYIDNLGKVAPLDGDWSGASGLTVSRQRQQITMQIGHQVTPAALLKASSQIRSLTGMVHFKFEKDVMRPFLGKAKSYAITEACLALGKYALYLIEKRSDSFETDKLTFLTTKHIPSLPAELMVLTDLRLESLETSTALTHFKERDVTDISFVEPTSEMTFRMRKMPENHAWPKPCPYLPVYLYEIVPKPFYSWFECLYHTAICARSPLLHQGQMKIAIRPSLKLPHTGDEAASSDMASMAGETATHNAEWHEFIRILYPLSSTKEKPINFRLLTATTMIKNQTIIL